MKCTVLGASGYIGSALCRHLVQLGYDVFAPERDDPRIFNEYLGHVFYAIGLTADFRRRPFNTVTAHVGVLQQVLECAQFDSLLYCSSTRVYLGAASTDEGATLAVNPNNPGDLYNLSKLLGESLCLNCGRDNVRIARLSNVIGGENPDSELFYFSLLRDARAGRVFLQTALESRKDYILREDAVHLLACIAFEGREAIYNVASGIQITNQELTDFLVQLTGCTVEFQEKAVENSFLPVMVSRVREEFSFQPRDPFERW